ncbi:MAG: Clp protease ClpP [Alistipes sp.]|nr:Clp protease ClpP [Alistipes sp.]
MNQIINISATATVATIDIEGIIGSQSESGAITTYQALSERLQQIEAIQAPMVVVNIRSVGGSVADALLIYEALRSLDAHITTRCYGYTASAATVIAQAASEGSREIASTALYLIHNSSCIAEGNAASLAQQAELLRKTDERIAAIYAANSGRSADHFAELMARNGGDGVWLSPEQAVEAGLVDTIITSDATPTASLIERVAAWLGIKSKSAKPTPQPPTDRLNILPQQGLCTPITLSEGQLAVQRSATQPVEDPDFDGRAMTANATAYNRDIAAFF